MKRILLTGVASAAFCVGSAFAADAVDAKKKEPPAPPPAWIDTLTINGFLDGGVAINPASPPTGVNFGQLFTDRANTPAFNQGVLTVQRPLDPKAEGIDYGFKVQTLIGTDGRYTHYLGEFDYLIHDRTQFSVVEAHGLLHLPILTKGGVDFKFGHFVTLNGYEVIPASDNLFYTHSYIFNFGPFQHTGAMAVAHATDWLDIYGGVTTGVNTSIGWPGDNNKSPSVLGGVGLNLLDGKLTILAVTHAGPENPKATDPYNVGWPYNSIPGGTPIACVCNVASTWRYYNNITTTWKVTDNLTLATDIAYMRENGGNPTTVTGLTPWQLGFLNTYSPDWPAAFTGAVPLRPQGAEAYGIAQYASYKVNDIVKVNGRVEYFRDNKDFFVAGFPNSFDAVNVQHGYFAPMVLVQPAGRGTSYLALTAGLTLTPELPKNPIFSGVTVRPEARWDVALVGPAPFNTAFAPLSYYPWGSTSKRTMAMFSMDVILPFTIR